MSHMKEMQTCLSLLDIADVLYRIVLQVKLKAATTPCRSVPLLRCLPGSY